MRTSRGSAGTLPPWRRLSVRVGLVVAVSMWGFVQFEPPISAAIGRWFGLRIHGPVALAPDLEGGCTIPAAVERAVARYGRPGAPELGAAVAAWDGFAGSAHVVTTFDLSTLGSDLPGAFPVGLPLEIPEEVEVAASFYPVWFDAETLEAGPRQELRWLCMLPKEGPFPYLPEDARSRYPAPGGVMADGTAVMTPAEFDAQVDEFLVIERVVRWLLLALMALCLAALVSWSITRRLVRLGRAAARPELDAFESVRVQGRDEIGALAAELASSRGRIAALLREVEDKDAQRREWFAQVSHDIRTPLTALGACLERAEPLASELPLGPDRDALLSTIEVARHDADRVLVLTTDLLEAARLELPNALRMEEVPPVEVAERAVRLLSPLAEREGKRIVLRSHGEPGPVRADGSRLMRVLENLLRNGIHFASSEVVVEVNAEDGRARVTVTDDGPGFAGSAEEATRNDPRGRDRADSAGLGLVVVARALAAHGVDLELDNRPEGGARLSFAMDCVPEPSGTDSGVFTLARGA